MNGIDMEPENIKIEYSTNGAALYHEVPNTLKQLARIVTYNFFPTECVLLVDMLIRNICMKEDDLCEMLKFDKKVLRARISSLRADRIIRWRIHTETGPDNKVQRIYHYFMNYKTLVRNVKLKLDKMRESLEATSRKKLTNAVFNCVGCPASYTDLDIDKVYDFTTDSMCCCTCGSLVTEDSLDTADSRTLFARFNQQMEVIYDLVRTVGDIQFIPAILDPPVADIKLIKGLQYPAEKTVEAKPARGTYKFVLTKNGLQEVKIKKEIPRWMRSEDQLEDLIETIPVEPEIDVQEILYENELAKRAFLKKLQKYEKHATQKRLEPKQIKKANPDPDLNKKTNNEGNDGKPSNPDEAKAAESKTERKLKLERCQKVLVKGVEHKMNKIKQTHINQMTDEEKKDYISKYTLYWNELV